MRHVVMGTETDRESVQAWGALGKKNSLNAELAEGRRTARGILPRFLWRQGMLWAGEETLYRGEEAERGTGWVFLLP